MTDLTETKEGEWLAICPRFKPFNYYKILYELFDENTKLKELLKECRENIASIDYDSPVLDKEQSILLNKISQALEEDK